MATTTSQSNSTPDPSVSAGPPHPSPTPGWKPPSPEPFPEPPSDGIHHWTLSAAWWCKRNGLTAENARKKIEAYDGKLRRPLAPGEVAESVAKAYGTEPKPSSGREAKPRWPLFNKSARDHAVAISPVQRIVDLRNYSQPIPTDRVAQQVAEMLFPGNPLVCVGGTPGVFGTALLADFNDSLDEASFIVPSPMTALTGRRQSDGEPSAHTLENTGSRKYLGVEFDKEESLDAQAALIAHLASGAPLVSICYSGNKSLHALYDVEGHPEAAVLKLFRYCVSLGADHATWSRCQFVRLPGGWNVKTNRRQEVHYLNIGNKMAQLPAPPELKDDTFPWDLRDGSVTWTDNPQALYDLSDPPIVDGLLREKEVVTVVGAAKTSKTWFALAVALAVAIGGKFIERTCYKRKVLYLDYELKEGTFTRRMSMLANARPDGFFYQCLRGSLRLPTVDEIVTLIESEKIGLLVVDSLYRTGWITEENNNDSTGRELTVLQQITSRTSCTIITVDHTAKGGGNERSAVDAARGASSKGGFYDAILVLRATDKGPDPEATYAILDPVLRDWPRLKELPLVSFSWSAVRCVVECAGQISGNDPNLVAARILDYLGADDDGAGIKQMSSFLGMSETSLRRALEQLITAGKILKEADPHHKQRSIYRLVPLPEEDSEKPPAPSDAPTP